MYVHGENAFAVKFCQNVRNLFNKHVFASLMSYLK